MGDEERDLIVEHAFETPERLRTSILVGFAFPTIKAELIRR